MGRYYINENQVRERARVPGVWERLFESLPLEGQERVREGRVDTVRNNTSRPVGIEKATARLVTGQGAKKPVR